MDQRDMEKKASMSFSHVFQPLTKYTSHIKIDDEREG